MRRLIAWFGRFATSLLLRRVEVAGLDRLPTGRPVLLVANHFNGFVDPLVVTSVLGRLPRFVAKDALRRIPILGLALRAAGVAFVRRAGDGGRADNAEAFAECHRALAQRDVVAIFPEGTTHDRPRMDPIKTGAARIALGARTAGADGVVIVPVGLTFPDKVALRSSALVQLGLPIELDSTIPLGVGADDVEAVRRLTAAIDAGLRAVSQDFPDTETALALEQAAHIALSGEDEPDPSLAARYELARQLGRCAPEVQGDVRREVGRYATLLAGLQLTDADVIAPTNPRRLLRSAIGIAVLVVLLGSIVAATVLVNVWPALLVALVSLVVRTPVTKGTVRVLVGLVAFPTAWIVAANVTAEGFLPVTGLVATMAVGALAALWLVERALALALMLLRWRAQLERIAHIDQAEALRAEVVATVRRARAAGAAR
ncbi:MAG TPA: 1-acyl-sn-glycerol-3-phosphate acyltransferase [Acidimicrobiales bacterium]|nr:1-acyl-sn-glycerol-3-phosphate acyltransferase [Acidimicrobiales bacterium]